MFICVIAVFFTFLSLFVIYNGLFEFIFQNLDVNLAVNNLLSRDEDDGDDDDNPEYLPGGEIFTESFSNYAFSLSAKH